MKNIVYEKLVNKKEKIVVILIGTMIIGFIVSLIKFILSVTIPSLWFFVNAIFGFVLALNRLIAIKKYYEIKQINDKSIILEKEKSFLKANGFMILLLGIAYFFVSLYMCYKKTNTNMHEYITYLVALIAFSSIGNAIYGMIKYKKKNEPFINGVKVTNFLNALTNIVLTQVVLLDTYSQGYNSKINGYTGICVSLIISVIGFYMMFEKY